MQKDPLSFGGGDVDVYAYCGGDPVNVVDPSGLRLNDPITRGVLQYYRDQAEREAERWGPLYQALRNRWDRTRKFYFDLNFQIPVDAAGPGITGGVIVNIDRDVPIQCGGFDIHTYFGLTLASGPGSSLMAGEGRVNPGYYVEGTAAANGIGVAGGAPLSDPLDPYVQGGLSTPGLAVSAFKVF